MCNENEWIVREAFLAYDRGNLARMMEFVDPGFLLGFAWLLPLQRGELPIFSIIFKESLEIATLRIK